MNTPVYLCDYIQEWLTTFKSASVKPSTYDRLLVSAAALSSYAIAHMPIGEITAFHIQKYVNELTAHGYGLSTIKKQMRIVTAPLRQASALHLIQADPTIGVRLPAKQNVKKPPREIEAYSEEEQARLCRIFESLSHPAFACAIIMIESGLRVGEALALEWKNVQIEKNKILVRETVVRLADQKRSFVQDSPKSESSRRVIPMTPKARKIFLELYLKRKTNWVFETEKRTRPSYESLRYQIKKACAQANVEYRGEHVFRHTFATNCYHKGMEVKILSKLLGHSDVNVTYNIYIHLYGDGFDELYEALVPKNTNGQKKKQSFS